MSTPDNNALAGGQMKVLSQLLWLVAPVAFGLFALVFGQDANWDLRNYHYYNAYAFLHGRLGFDIAPAQTPTYYNPLLHVPFYYLVNALPPRGVGFVLGAVQGMNLPLIFAIARRVIRVATPRYGIIIALCAAILGMLGAANISEIGTTFGDNVFSLPLLAALWLVVARQNSLSGAWSSAAGTALAAGVLSGLAVGLKQPAAVYAIGLGYGFFGLALPWRRRGALFLAFGVGGMFGLAATGGYWLYEMWSHFGNPLFPYFNSVFQSPMASAADYRDVRFLPAGWLEWLFFPLVFTLDPGQTTEGWFRDLRIPLLYCLLLALLLSRLAALAGVKSGARKSHVVQDAAYDGMLRYLLIAAVVSYFAWLKMFAVFRYLLVLELLTPLAIWLVVTRLLNNLRGAVIFSSLSAVVILATLFPLHWGRVSWSDDYFGVTPPAIPDPDHSMVLATGYEPTAYLIPFFPPQIRFLRIQSYFTGPSSTPNGTDLLMQRLVVEHQGPLYILYQRNEEPTADSALQSYGLQRQANACQTMHPHIQEQSNDLLYFCQVNKVMRQQSDNGDKS
jgi:hypothetical protein